MAHDSFLFGDELDPDRIRQVYESGMSGVHEADIYTRARFAPQTRFYAAYPEAIGLGAGRVSLPVRAILAMPGESGFPAYSEEAQRTGDCMAKDVRNAGMLDYSVDCLMGETKWKGRLAEEPIYGMRGHGGQGADPFRLCGFVGPNGTGGFVYRARWEGPSGQVADLSKYDSGLSHSWGRTGTPEWLQAECRKNKSLRMYRASTYNEVRDALAAGFGVSTAGMEGWSSTRNGDGVAAVTTRWSHAVTAIGFDDTDWAKEKYGGLVLLGHNWGSWNRGPRRHEQPDGTWWSRWQDVSRRTMHVIGAIRGYDRTLNYDRAATVRDVSKQ